MSNPPAGQQQPAPTPTPAPTPAPAQQQPPAGQQQPTPTLLASGGIAPGPHRLHPSYVVLSALRAVVSIIVVAFFGIASSLPSIAIGAGAFLFVAIAITVVVLILVLGAAAGFAYLSYKRFLWEITQSDIHIYSGIIFKKQAHIPFQRVQSIDFQAGVIERILGIVKLKIETAGGASNQAALIPALKLNQAEILRSEIFARKQVSDRQQAAAVQQKIREKRAAQTVAPAPLFDPETGQPLPVQRFDPQTGEPLTAAPAAPAAPRFDLQTGELLPPLAASAADDLVREFGDGAAGLRGIFAESYEESAPIEYEYGLTAKELVLAAVSSDHNVVFFLVLAGIISQLSQFIGLFGLEDVAEQALTYTFNHYALPAIIIGAIVLFVVTLLLGIVSTAISYGGFKARRRGGRIEVERGLLSRQSKGVSVSRVQSVEIRQGFIRRLMGYAELKLLTVDTVDTSGNQQNGQTIQTGLTIHPFVKLDRVEGILMGLASEFNGRPPVEEYKRLPKVAGRRSINRLAIFPTIFYAVIATGVTLVLSLVPEVPSSIATPIIIGVWVLVVALLALHIGAAILWYKHAAYAYNPTMLVLRQGSYGQVTTIIPRKKIQWASTHQNPFQRFSKVATVAATTAAGISGTKTALRDLRLDEADAFIDWVRPRKSKGLTAKQ